MENRNLSFSTNSMYTISWLYPVVCARILNFKFIPQSVLSKLQTLTVKPAKWIYDIAYCLISSCKCELCLESRDMQMRDLVKTFRWRFFLCESWDVLLFWDVTKWSINLGKVIRIWCTGQKVFPHQKWQPCQDIKVHLTPNFFIRSFEITMLI